MKIYVGQAWFFAGFDNKIPKHDMKYQIRKKENIDLSLKIKILSVVALLYVD